jgi:hypothetical protein
MAEGRGERVTETPEVTINDPDDAIGGVAGGGGSGERATGTPNTVYNLSSVLFHALQGGASYDTYIEDAEQEGDEDLTEFFRRVREEDRDRAAEARMLLAKRTPTASPTEAATAGDSPGREQIGSFPAEGDVTSGSTEQAASPRPEPSDDFPGTEPVEGEDPTARSGEVPPPPEEIPPERAGEIPMAEEVPAPRAEEIPTDTQTQASPGDATSPVPGDILHEDMVPPTPPPPRGTGESPMAEEERVGQEEGEEDRSLIDRLTDRARDGLTGEEEQGREGDDKPGRR